jgi:hypothetical protein
MKGSLPTCTFREAEADSLFVPAPQDPAFITALLTYHPYGQEDHILEVAG